MIIDEKDINSEPEIYDIFRKRFKKKRSEKSFTFEELERITGIKRSSLQRYESGNTGKIPIDAVDRLEKALGVSPGYLLGWNDSSEPVEEKKSVFPNFPPPVRSAFPSSDFRPNRLAEEPKKSYSSFSTSYADDFDFCVTMPDDSMTDARLKKDDLVYISKSAYIKNGEIAAFTIKGETQIRYYYRTDDGHTLCASSRSIPPLSVKNLEEAGIKLLGKAVAFKSKL